MINHDFKQNDVLIANMHEDYKDIVHGHKVGPIGHEVTLKEIGACCGKSRGMIVTFFSRLSLLFRKHIWLNENRVNEYLDLEHFSRMEKTVAKIQIVRDNIRAQKAITNKLPATTPKEHKYILMSTVKLDKMERRLQRIQSVCQERLNLQLKEHQELKKQRTEPVPNEPWSINDVPDPIPDWALSDKPWTMDDGLDVPKPTVATIYPGLPIAEKLADQATVQENVQLLDLTQKATEVIGEVAMNYVNEAVGVSVPKIFQETIASTVNIRGVATTGISNLLDFLKTNYLANTRGKSVIENLPIEYKAKIREYINLERDIYLINNTNGHPLRDKLSLLEARKKNLDVLMDEIRKHVENDSIGQAVPVTRDAAISAADRYFNGLTQAIKSLKNKNPGFNNIPSQIKQYMILSEMKLVNEAEPEEHQIKTPIFVPVLEIGEQAIVEDLVKKINEGVHPSDFNDDEIVLLGGMEEEIRLKFVAGDPNIDKKLGGLGKEAMEKLLFPHGIPLGSSAEFMLKLSGKNLDELQAEALTKIMKIVLDKVTDPHIINKMLEKALDKAFDKVADVKTIELEIGKINLEIKSLQASRATSESDDVKIRNESNLKRLEKRLESLKKAENKKIEIANLKAEIETANQKYNAFDDVLSIVFDLEEYNKNQEHIQDLNYKLAKLEGKAPETIEELFYNRIRAESKKNNEGLGNPEMTGAYVNIGLNLATLAIPDGNAYERQVLHAAAEALEKNPENCLKIQKMIEQPINDLALSFDNKMLIKLIQMGMDEILDEKGDLNPELFDEDGTVKSSPPTTAQEKEVVMERIKGKIDQLTSAGINLGSDNAFLKPFLPSKEMIAEHSNNLYNVLTMSEVNKVLVTEMFAGIIT